MKALYCEQGSDEWLAARAGRVTSSRIADVVRVMKRGGESSKREHYKMQLVTEILAGRSFDTGYKSRAMKEGKEAEPMARAAYELRNDVMVETVGFVLHPKIELAGASPDGLVGDNGLVEIKAPEVTTHVGYLLDGGVPEEYQPQCIWLLACTGRQWVDFVSYDKSHELPERDQLMVVRFTADDEVIADHNQKVRQFLAECDQLLAQLETRVTA
jgi:putative phage-type endonuclease